MSATQKHYLNFAIGFIFMFFFQLLPAPAPITPYGMKLIGIFIGIIYLWTTEDILWSSILGLVAMVCLGIFTGNELTSAAFGQSLLIMLLFVLAIIFCMDKSGLFDWIANWMQRLKFVQGRPWVLVTMLFALVFVVTLVGNGSLIIFLIWSIIYKIGKKVGYTRENKWMAAMVVGISMTSIVGQHVLPFRPGPLYMLAVFQQTSGIEINAVKYILMQGTLSICLIALYILVMRFVLRLDVSALKEIDMEEFTGERQPMTKQQKFLLFCLFVMVFALILPSILTFLPKNVVTNTIGSLNTVGMSWILFVILCVLHIDGKPVLVFREIADKVLWEMLALMACALTIAPALAGEGTGVTEALQAILAPIFGGHGPIFFAVVLSLFCLLATNIANNAVITMIGITVLITYMKMGIGVNGPAVMVILVLLINMAILIPAASGYGAMLHSQAGMVTKGNLYKYAVIAMLCTFLVYTVIGLPLGYLIFPM